MLVVPAQEKTRYPAGSEPFDLVVLDVMLPGISGVKVTETLRSDPKFLNIPIIMLTAKSEEPDIVSGLALADDYVTKPFSPKILCARISAVLRRKSEPSEKNILRRGDISIDLGRRRVEICGESVELSFSEFQILMILSKRPGWVFTRSQIVDGVISSKIFNTLKRLTLLNFDIPVIKTNFRYRSQSLITE